MDINSKEIIDADKIKNRGGDQDENKTNECIQSDNDDIVSGFLYDRLQKEVICLRKLCETKEFALNTKDEEIKVKYYHKKYFSWFFFSSLSRPYTRVFNLFVVYRC